MEEKDKLTAILGALSAKDLEFDELGQVKIKNREIAEAIRRLNLPNLGRMEPGANTGCGLGC